MVSRQLSSSSSLCRCTLALLTASLLQHAVFAEEGTEAPSRSEASAALRRAVAFFREKVAVHGGYVWRYSADLRKREGEGRVGASTAWVQPPGTPLVGEALVEIHELTGERYYLEAARETAGALLRGQLRSGGWTARIEFEPAARRRFAYRVDTDSSRRARDVSSLDDDITQSALRFLMNYDRVTEFREGSVHEAVLVALRSLLAAQLPAGGWPQVYRSSPPAHPAPEVKRARYDEKGEYPRVKAYWDFYTLNDNLMSRVIETLLLASRVYDEERYRQAALKGGDFLILAQMPDPQPGWAQQYDFEMRPAWARKFEPPAISGSESQSVMMTLLDLYEETGDRKYLEPIPRALAYYRGSLLSDGRLARFYELKTNRPLYFTRDYELTYSDADVPTHYSFKVHSRLDAIERRLERLRAKPGRRGEDRPGRPAASVVREIIAGLDERGAWVEDGRMRFWGKGDVTRRIVDPSTFARNATRLARYVRRP